MSAPNPRITGMLEAYRQGDSGALDAIVPAVYRRLKIIAGKQLRSRNGTLSPTALVHELFVKLKDGQTLKATDTRSFIRMAAACMRRLIVDIVRRQQAEKRGGGEVRITLDEQEVAAPTEDVNLAALNEALEKLTAQDERLARVVELRYLLGLTIEETAEALESSPMTVKRDWAMARAWLRRELGTNVED